MTAIDNTQLPESQIEEFLKQLLGRSDRVNWDHQLLDEGLIVSMEILSLVTFLEERFQIAIDPFEISPDSFSSIRAMAEFVRSKRQS